MNNHPPILAFTSRLLPLSQTFVYDQSIRLSNYDAYLLGAKLIKKDGIPLPQDRVQLINRGGPLGFSYELLFKILGVLPREVAGWIANLRPSLIHAHFGLNGAVILPLSEKYHLPLIVSFHGSDASLPDRELQELSLSGRLYVKRRERLIQRVDRVIVPSNFLKWKVMAQGFPENKIALIHHGVDMQDFRPRSGATGDKHILFVGRLIAVKGLSYLIRAICLVREAEPDVRLTVIGDGPMRQEYESQARKELVTGYEFLGAQPHSAVKACMEASYLFSMPSITMPNGQAEAFGLVFVEAQAMGLPVVSFISGAIPEVVSHGETGLLVNEGDIDGLAAALIQLLRSRTLRDKLGAAARQRAITMFDLEKQNEKLERLYGEVLAAAGLSSR